VYAQIARAIARCEPLTLVTAPGDDTDARRRCGSDVEVVVIPINDSWIRDTGPIVVFGDDGCRYALHFRFNAWGGKYESYEFDERVGASVAGCVGLPVRGVPVVLEGGSIAVDGAGTLVTTERCLLNPNRSGYSRDSLETGLRECFGVERIVWLADAIAEDDGTDGHVDNVVAFSAPGRTLLQGCADVDNPNHLIAKDNCARLEAAGIEVTEVPHLPYASVGASRPLPVPYVNLYALNGAVLVPTAGAPTDDDALAIIAGEYPGREVIAVPGAVLAHGGGGVHCITMQVPA
jgi:agmatine deiminase